MKTTKLFKELGSTEAIKYLTTEFGIKAREYPDFVLLNYDQIESPKTNEYVIECRSLIVDYTGEVVSRSFDRFFNYGEALEHQEAFDWNSSVVYEKADGSLIKVYYNPFAENWEISTRGSAFAEVDHVMGGTFREKVLAAFGWNEDQFQFICDTELHPKFTYIFEYCGPENRIVTRYETSQMVLIGIRDNLGTWINTFIDTVVENLVAHQFTPTIRAVKRYHVNDPAELVEMAKNLPALDEGYVAWDYQNDIRIKIKNPSYVAIHKIRENGQLSIKRVCSLVLENDHEEYLTYFPEDEQFFQEYIEGRRVLLYHMGRLYNDVKNIADQKSFALGVKDYPWSSVFFTARKTGRDPVTCFNEMRMEYRIDLLLDSINTVYPNFGVSEEVIYN